MAMYVLVAFDDDQHAKNWIKVQETYAARRKALTDEEAPADTGNYEVVAMYKKPTMFCNVMDGNHPSTRRVIGFTKGTKWGWWVCARCSKPREMYVEGIVANSGFGYNLLPKNNQNT
jgi:hypothetical protein